MMVKLHSDWMLLMSSRICQTSSDMNVTGLPPLAAHTGLSHVDCDTMEVEEEDDG